MTNLNSENTIKVSQQDSCIISEINLSTSTGSVENTYLEYEQKSWNELCDNLKKPLTGKKEGSYICAGRFDNNYRNSENMHYPHDFFILDGDSTLIDGKAVKGAPDPALVHKVLKELNLQHIIFSTHSNKSVSDDYNRYRVLIPASISSKDALEACINWVIVKLHESGVMLENATENMTQGAPWYLPRVTKDNKDSYYFAEHSIDCTAFPIQEAINKLSVNKSTITSKSKDNQGCNISLKDVINGVPDGCRNVMVFRYACHLKGRGLTCEEAESLVFTAAANCTPPLDKAIAIEKLKSAYSYPDDSLSEAEDLCKVKNHPLDEVGNASRLIDIYGDVIKYPNSNDDYNVKKWLIYNGKGWRSNTDGSIERLALATINSIVKEGCEVHSKTELANHIKRSRKANHVMSMLLVASWDEAVRIKSNSADDNPMLIGTLNGVVNLETGEIIQNSQEYLITKRVNASFDEGAECPNWDRFLNRITGEDQEMIEYLNLLTSYFLTGKTNEHALFIIHGPGANGKTTWVECIQAIMGEYASQMPVESLSYTKSNAIDDNLARTRGSRLTVTSEIKKGARLNEPLIKQLTGGDKVTARQMFKGSIEYKPTSKFIIVVNHLPEITGSDNAMARRVQVIPFTQVIQPDEEDKFLSDKLKGEYDAIFTRAVLMCPEWLKHGLPSPKSIVEASSNYVQSKDVFKQWKNECLRVDVVSKDFTGSTKLLESHKIWCNEHLLNAIDVNTFHSRMKECTGNSSTTKAVASVRVRGYKGVKLVA
jgi:putative DNA primase/helicase